jgi:hypothetical protein
MATANDPSQLSDAVRAAMSPLPPGYHRLLERLVERAARDERIRAVWLGGSLGRREGDAGSDLDVLLAVDVDALPDFAAGWREWLATITATVIARELPALPGSFFSVTADCERLDVVVEPVRALDATPYRQRLVVVDKDGLDAAVPAIDSPGTGPSVERLAAIVEEFFREQAIFPAAVVARQDWLLGVVAVSVTHRMLYDLFVETNQPLPAMGIKRWSARLTPHQRDVLAALRPPAAERDSTIDAMWAARHAIRTHGRHAVETAGGGWPQHLDDTVARYLQSELGWSPEP